MPSISSGSFLYIAAVQESQHGPTVSWENLKTKLAKSAHVIQQNWIEVKWEEHCWANTTYNYNHVYLAAKKSNTNEQQGKRYKNDVFLHKWGETMILSIMDGERHSFGCFNSGTIIITLFLTVAKLYHPYPLISWIIERLLR